MKLKNLKQDNSLSERVYQQLHKSLVTGTLRPGQKIVESELATMMGISRTPIREAMKRLAKDHLIVLVPRSGCYVTTLSEKDIHEIYDIRLRLESMALEYAFDRLASNPGKLVQLKEDFENCIGEPEEKFIKSEIRLDTKLHNIISRQSDCPTLQGMLANLRARLELFRQQTTLTSTRAAQALQEHINIIQAILDNDEDLALMHFAEHIRHTKENVLSSIKREEAPNEYQHH